MLVNVTGSFIIGMLAALTLPEGRMSPKAHQFVSQFLMVGVCGGYTTFSSFSLQTLNLVQEGQWWQAMGNIGGSVLFCLVAVWLGYVVGQVVNR
jgi:CrcB protein